MVPLGRPFQVREPVWRWGLGLALIDSDKTAVIAVAVSLLIEGFAVLVVVKLAAQLAPAPAAADGAGGRLDPLTLAAVTQACGRAGRFAEHDVAPQPPHATYSQAQNAHAPPDRVTHGQSGAPVISKDLPSSQVPRTGPGWDSRPECSASIAPAATKQVAARMGNPSSCATPCASRRSVSFSACWHRVTVS